MSNASLPNRSLHTLGQEILIFLEKHLWPLRIDRVFRSKAQIQTLEQKVLELTHNLEKHPSILSEWTEIQTPGVKEENTSPSVIERVRLFGPLRTKAFFVSATLRLDPVFNYKEKLNWINEPFPSWKIFKFIPKEDETSFDLTLECTILTETFLAWLKSSFSPAEWGRAKNFFEKLPPQWERLWNTLNASAREGNALPIHTIFRTQILFDFGRTILTAHSEKCSAVWNECEKTSSPLFIRLWKETVTFGFNSAQMGALWAPCFATWASISTPLRLLSRPWRVSHPQTKSLHKKTIDFLALKPEPSTK